MEHHGGRGMFCIPPRPFRRLQRLEPLLIVHGFGGSKGLNIADVGVKVIEHSARGWGDMSMSKIVHRAQKPGISLLSKPHAEGGP